MASWMHLVDHECWTSWISHWYSRAPLMFLLSIVIRNGTSWTPPCLDTTRYWGGGEANIATALMPSLVGCCVKQIAGPDYGSSLVWSSRALLLWKVMEHLLRWGTALLTLILDEGLAISFLSRAIWLWPAGFIPSSHAESALPLGTPAWLVFFFDTASFYCSSRAAGIINSIKPPQLSQGKLTNGIFTSQSRGKWTDSLCPLHVPIKDKCVSFVSHIQT